MSSDADDPVTNESGNPYLSEIVAERLRSPSRRDVMRGSLGLGALGWLGMSGASALLTACGDDLAGDPAQDPGPDARPPDNDPPINQVPTRPTALGFAAVAKSLEDVVSVPEDYEAHVLYSLGDPIAAGVSAYANNGTDTPASFEHRAGDHHDGMHFFGLSSGGDYGNASSDRGLLVMNHEAITPLFLHPTGATIAGTGNAAVRTVADEVQREFFLHGVSIIEVRRSNGAWSYVQDSKYNRRIHTLTEMEISGPVRGADAVRTKYSNSGTRTRGTVNNCANGYTPWGTYLTCEENWASYFRRIAADDNPRRTPKDLTSFARYGVAGTGRELWATPTPDTNDIYARWNTMATGTSGLSDYRNVAYTYGWVVEIDPFTNTSRPKKRTALGRFGHEGCWPAPAVAGKPLVFYSGDDSRGEYIYKYVSNAVWDPQDLKRSDRLTVGDKYLDNGKLYVAKFSADGTGEWVELAYGKNGITLTNSRYAFADQADVLVNARLAADTVGATPMDRPEWIAVDPVTGAIYTTLTNNNMATRPVEKVDAANPRFYSDLKGNDLQLGNPNGHIIRWKESSPEVTTFEWDIYLFGAASDADRDSVNLSGLTADNDFSSPDGLWFSTNTNILWIQTDDGAYTDVTNCMLLAALPGSVGDGASQQVTSVHNPVVPPGSPPVPPVIRTVATYIGAAPGQKLKRFLVGPKDCELTGIAETPDGTALFVNIQHPGETTPAARINDPISIWPSNAPGARPRSSTLVITKKGGGRIGL